MATIARRPVSTDHLDVFSPRQILILRPGAIGDTLLTFPALQALRRQYPAARLTVVGNRAPLALGRAAGLVDDLDAFGADWVADLFGDDPAPALQRRLAAFDLGIVWMHDESAAIDLAERLARAGVRRALPLVSFPAPGSQIHLADHLLATLAPLGVSGPRPVLRLRPRPNIPEESARTSARPAPPRRVILHPGAGGRHKRWPADRFAALADRLAAEGNQISLTCGPADEEAVAAVLRLVQVARPEVLAGRSLEDLAKILAAASLFVGNDSGITHLAALLGTPTVAIFGPYDPAYWAPLGEQVVVVDAGSSCDHRADPRDGCRQCNPLATLDLEVVWAALRQIWDGE